MSIKLLRTVVALVALFFSLNKISAGDTAKTSLWRVTSDEATLYLVGSIHLLRAQDHPLPSLFDEAYAQSSTLYFEVLPDSMQSADSLIAMQKYGAYPQGETARDHLSEDTYAAVEKFAVERGLGMALLEQWKPWMMMLTIASMEYLKLGMLPQFGLEMHFDQKSLADGKKRVGLESLEFQLTVLDELSVEKQEDFLLKTIESIDRVRSEIPEIIAAWRVGNAESLNALVNKEFADEPEIFDLLVTRRNLNWVDQLEPLLKKEGTTMVIVGAGHLVGEKGLVALFAERGYRVEQVEQVVAQGVLSE